MKGGIPMNEEAVLARLADAEKSLARFEGDIKTLFNYNTQQQELLNTVNALARSVDRQTVVLEQQGKDLNRLQTDVNEIKAKPSKRWDTVIVAIITAIVGFALAKLGIK